MAKPGLVHWSYLVGDPDQEYCIALGGRCYREKDVYAQQMEMVQCPVCNRQFSYGHTKPITIRSINMPFKMITSRSIIVTCNVGIDGA